MLNQFPLEILGHVLSFLERDDLQALRLVDRALSRKVEPVLFRTICVSILTIDRLQKIASDPKLSIVVEELVYQECDFDPSPKWDADRPWFSDVRMSYLSETIAQFNVYVRRGMQGDMEESPGSGLPEDETSMVKAEVEAERVKIDPMLTAVKQSYSDLAALQTPSYLHQVFRDAFRKLPKLRRVICVEPEAGCPSLDSLRLERAGALQELSNIFPLSDHAVRSCLQPDSWNWPSHGFMGIWRALSDQHSNPGIQHFEIRRDSDLFLKRGIFLLPISMEPAEPEAHVLVNGFRNLTVLSLCLEVNISSRSFVIPQAPLLSRALARATQLRRLEICLTSCGVTFPGDGRSEYELAHEGIPFGDYEDTRRENILPFVSFPELHTVVLEEVDVTARQICSWLFMQPKLRHLTLRRPYLQGRWQDVLQRWSDNPEFQLDSFELVSPWDHDNRDLETRLDCLGRWNMPSRVSSDALLAFINQRGGGGTNPFKHRRWKLCDEFEFADYIDDVQDDNVSEYSDVSEWLPEDHPTPVADPEGPEFDEDYDFDAEADSDIEMEGV
ncbi:hypothetical protein AYL99_04178 [Fonsecaea erecta]|uniref:F-box domain-containing protein n=1 Tax=Fonsecaea erecta TaxID=1367422 RepID=A0A178ZSK3_9EURO|nr:hypothetical protein AYL99_04178 [Fonsecaea erecta]OAP61975.1 hypothetical protein AYL99_04178 [Fonsecaea erecta]